MSTFDPSRLGSRPSVPGRSWSPLSSRSRSPVNQSADRRHVRYIDQNVPATPLSTQNDYDSRRSERRSRSLDIESS